MRKLALLIGFCGVLAAQRAEAVPQTVSFTGRLSTSTGPVTGSVNLTFKLFDVATGGTEVWSEVRNGVGANSQGLVFVDLGEVTTLDSTLFTGARMYLEITVGSEVLAPRLAINSVPYAMQTDNAAMLGGSVTAADVITTAAGANGVTATKTGNTLNVSLSTTGCNTGEVFKYNGTTFTCAADNNSPPAAGAGIAVSGNTVSLGTTGCAAGYVWKYTGAAWACSPDADTNTTYTAGAGISISGTTISLNTTGCVAGEVWKYTGATWACSADTDTNTTYTAASNSGITISGTALSVDPTDFTAVPASIFDSTASVNTTTSVGTTITSRSITVPVAGTIVAIAAADTYCSSCTNGTSEFTGFYSWLTMSSTGSLTTPYTYFNLTNAGSIDNYNSFSMFQTFTVAAGTHTIYLRGAVSNTAEPANVSRTKLVLMFFPS